MITIMPCYVFVIPTLEESIRKNVKKLLNCSMRDHNYFVYILTNYNKTVLYTGVTNDLAIRIEQHKNGDNRYSFTKKYKCFYLVNFERYQYINDAIDREKEIKGWTRAKKDKLIESENKEWRILNEEIMDD
ncbi:GIY-YIG nuclease family protein [Pedobacter sp. UC225_61]|uniref:GIY-YIG nuclease family protein n=1 Tax=Pedobacter sp. UC225_61 TaxID=3374623 RepID=UPI0037AF21D8